MWGRGKHREGLSEWNSEGQRIWSIKIGCATSLIIISSVHLSNDFTDISDTTHPNLAIDSLWITQPWCSIHSSLSQVIGSSCLSIYILFFHDELLCFILLLFFFLIYHLIHPVLKWNFLESSSDSLMSNHLQISGVLLSHSGFPHVI